MNGEGMAEWVICDAMWDIGTHVQLVLSIKYPPNIRMISISVLTLWSEEEGARVRTPQRLPRPRLAQIRPGNTLGCSLQQGLCSNHEFCSESF